MDHLLSKETSPSLRGRGEMVKRLPKPARAKADAFLSLHTAFAVFSSVIFKVALIFENWKLEIKENYNVYRDLEVGVRTDQRSEHRARPLGSAARERSGRSEDSSTNFLAKRIRAHDGCLGIRRL